MLRKESLYSDQEKIYEICSKLTIKAPEQRQWRRSSDLLLFFITHFTYCSSASIDDFEQVNAGWGELKKNHKALALCKFERRSKSKKKLINSKIYPPILRTPFCVFTFCDMISVNFPRSSRSVLFTFMNNLTMDNDSGAWYYKQNIFCFDFIFDN